jgi:L-seryl-tRNA(Ser) seleniumtransferase
MAASGATLVEVGTTNRTHLADYEKAITPDTAAILKVHPSNFAISGFTSAVDARDLARLARGRGVCFIYDVGSGLVGYDQTWPAEPTVTGAIEDGADVVTFSGDKLLGGPQAGVIAGRSELVARIGRHPLMRALRVDKMTLAALEETLRLYLEGDVQEIPLVSRMRTSVRELEERARRIAAVLSDMSDTCKIEVTSHAAVAGGGSSPGAELTSVALSVVHPDIRAAEIERGLRSHATPIIARVDGDRVLLDLRTVDPLQDDALATALRSILS